MTRAFLKQVVSLYYDQLDYQDFIELLKYKVFDMDSGVDISEVELKSYGENLRHNDPYIMTPDKYITGWSEMAAKNEYKQCVNLNLRCAFSKLLPRLKNKNVLSDDNMNEFFKNNGGFTIKNIIIC